MNKQSKKGSLLPGGQKIDGLHVVLEGKPAGYPPVVFEHGCGVSSEVWSLVYPEIAKLTQTLVYDRAGYGFSDPGPLPRTSDRCVEDLRRLVERLRIARPFILVGHSLGGFYARLYTERYPEDVAALVLIDASHEDEIRGIFPLPYLKRQKLSVRLYGLAKRAARIGLLPWLAEKRWIPGFASFADKLPERSRNAMWARVFGADSLAAAESEYDCFVGETGSVPRSRFARLPLAVVKAGIYRPSKSPKVTVKQTLERTLYDTALKMKQLSEKSRLIEVEGSGHHVQVDKPGTVIGILKRLLELTRAGARNGEPGLVRQTEDLSEGGKRS
ncbi:alpha/beta fold hydrolase [Saccharibacillus alkalitolerans]|uniref:Alpha/beta hydrolase n=1 Tax=Saccharibacillus alkalitolerans TaxID=2705290 RepID=A0ABX0F7Y2_9BACL|nr:alpha/beta hydrolase [Saccharibacillus alkalitolerans]NGZ75614.1 alpha/beta hydrolase [Saccharibacillus alkalitolerans]